MSNFRAHLERTLPDYDVDDVLNILNALKVYDEAKERYEDEAENLYDEYNDYAARLAEVRQWERERAQMMNEELNR